MSPHRPVWIESPSEKQIELLHPSQDVNVIPTWVLAILALLSVSLKIRLVWREEVKKDPK